MEYKRIARTKFNYALYPKNIDIDELIDINGSDYDYYESIYNYKQEHYDNFINGLKKACEYTGVKFNSDDLLNTSSKVRMALKKAAEKGDEKAEKIKALFSVAGTTEINTNKLVFDFDSTDMELSRRDTIEVCSRLISSGIPRDALQISFSGNKGFSVEVETDLELNRKEFENIVNNFSKDLKTFDTSVKDQQRLFRIPLTKHDGSGLYKIPLALEELTTTESSKIRNLASNENFEKNKNEFIDIINSWVGVRNPESIVNLKALTLEKVKKVEVTFEDRLELSRKPKWLSSTKFALQEGFFKGGSRNTAFMILAATYRSEGFPKEIAWRMLKGVAELQAKRNKSDEYSEDKLWKEIISVVYGDNWRGGTYSESETDLLKQTAEMFNLNDEIKENRIVKIEDVNTRFKDFAKNIDKNTIKTGIPTIDENVLITTGMTVGVLGAPSAGKSTLANGFVRNLSLNDENVMYESLDMSDNLLYTRFLQQYCRYDMRKILHMVQHDEVDKKLSDAFEQVKNDYKNVGFSFRSGTTVEDIENDIKARQDLTGKKLRLVVVDYLEKVRGPYSDDTANTGYVASRLADLAREYDLCMTLLLQPQKSAGDPREPLLSMRKVKGASKIEQDCRVIMTMWRPGFNPKDMSDDRYASIAVVKNNMGTLGQFDFNWDGLSGRIRDLTNDEKYCLDELLQRIEEEKKAENDTNDW